MNSEYAEPPDTYCSTLDAERTITSPKTVNIVAIVTTRWNDANGRANQAPIRVLGPLVIASSRLRQAIR
ncbi:hypothetical protein GCM10020255_088280 [Rhodococcus baikonurensis]